MNVCSICADPVLDSSEFIERLLIIKKYVRNYLIYLPEPPRKIRKFIENQFISHQIKYIFTKTGHPFLFLLFFLITSLKLIKKIRKLKIQLLVTHEPHYGGALSIIVSKILGLNQLIILRTYDNVMNIINLVDYLNKKKAIISIIFAILSIVEKFTIRHSKLVVVKSNQTREFVMKKYGTPAKQIIVMPTGVNLKHFYDSSNKNFLSKRYQIKNCPIIMYIGRVIPQKGIHILIKAFQLVKKEFGRAKLLIIGPSMPKYKEKLEQTIKALHIRNDVRLLGYITYEFIPRLLNSADLLVHPALRDEGLPVIIQEALATGTPVIATNIKGNNEIIQHMKNGLLVPPNDYTNLAKAIFTLLNDSELRKQLSIKGIQSVKEKYDREKNFKELIYLSVKKLKL